MARVPVRSSSSSCRRESCRYPHQFRPRATRQSTARSRSHRAMTATPRHDPAPVSDRALVERGTCARSSAPSLRFQLRNSRTGAELLFRVTSKWIWPMHRAARPATLGDPSFCSARPLPSTKAVTHLLKCVAHGRFALSNTFPPVSVRDPGHESGQFLFSCSIAQFGVPGLNASFAKILLGHSGSR